MTPRAGVTLVELMVVLAVLGVMAGVVAVSWQPQRPPSIDGSKSIAVLRRQAVASGRVIIGAVTVEGREATVIAFPDGRIAGAEQLRVNPLTGARSDADTVAR